MAKDVLFYRNRIRGVSFRRAASSSVRSFQKRQVKIVKHYELSLEDLRRACPDHFSELAINKILYDPSRLLAQQLLADCVEHATHWKQISHALDEYLSCGQTRIELEKLAEYNIDPLKISEEHSQILALEVRNIWREWKHRLHVLEMIANAQKSIFARRHLP